MEEEKTPAFTMMSQGSL
jgi:hypothetical protein